MNKENTEQYICEVHIFCIQLEALGWDLIMKHIGLWIVYIQNVFTQVHIYYIFYPAFVLVYFVAINNENKCT